MITQYDHDTHYAIIRGRGWPPLGISRRSTEIPS